MKELKEIVKKEFGFEEFKTEEKELKKMLNWSSLHSFWEGSLGHDKEETDFYILCKDGEIYHVSPAYDESHASNHDPDTYEEGDTIQDTIREYNINPDDIVAIIQQYYRNVDTPNELFKTEEIKVYLVKQPNYEQLRGELIETIKNMKKEELLNLYAKI